MKKVWAIGVLIAVLVIGSFVATAANPFSKYYNIDLEDDANDAYVYLYKSGNSVEVSIWTKADLTIWDFPAIREQVSVGLYNWDGSTWDFLTSVQSIANLIRWSDYDSESGTYSMSSGWFKIKVCEYEYYGPEPAGANESKNIEPLDFEWEHCVEDVVYIS